MRATAAADTDPVMHPAALADAIGRALPDDALVDDDGGHTSFWSNDLTPVHAPRTRFHDPGMCQLGGGLPWALALQRLEPGRPVFNLTGDGSFGFTLQELDTARREGLPVVTVIHDNAAWGIIRAGQQRAGFSLGTALQGTDYAAIARGFGCHGETVRTAAEVAPALVRALASGLPAVLDCRTRFVPHPAGQAFGSMNRYGFCTPAARHRAGQPGRLLPWRANRPAPPPCPACTPTATALSTSARCPPSGCRVPKRPSSPVRSNRAMRSPPMPPACWPCCPSTRRCSPACSTARWRRRVRRCPTTPLRWPTT